MLTEQQKQRIVELAERCEREMEWASKAGMTTFHYFRSCARKSSAEAFRIACGQSN